MLILYQGLKPKTFYWEFVNSLRKVLILMSFSLFDTYNPLYKIMISVIILLATFRIQVYLKPYKDIRNNEIEILGLLSGTLTLFSGLVFTSDFKQTEVLNALILIVVLSINLKFILQWSYLFILCMSERYLFFKRLLIIIRVLLCKKEKDLFTPSKPVKSKKFNNSRIKRLIRKPIKGRQAKEKSKMKKALNDYNVKEAFKIKELKKVKDVQEDETIHWNKRYVDEKSSPENDDIPKINYDENKFDHQDILEALRKSNYDRSKDEAPSLMRTSNRIFNNHTFNNREKEESKVKDKSKVKKKSKFKKNKNIFEESN